MKNTNKYGFISGGYIFDLLDRTALQAINEKYPETANQQVYTASADIRYFKQLCNTDNIDFFIFDCCYRDNGYGVFLELHQNDTIIATADFDFAVAKHNYCEQ